MNANSCFSRFADIAGLAISPVASLETLKALHKAWPSIIPFENIDVLLGKKVSINAADIAEKMLTKRRGGYCFEHNILFGEMLKELGFSVTSHLARVVWGRDTPAATPQTHTLLLVALDGINYLADVGFGGVSLTAPLRLEEGEQQGFLLERLPGGEWLLSANGESKRLMYTVNEQPCAEADILVASHFVETYSESIFRHNLMMAKIINGRQVNMFNRCQTTYGAEKQEQEAQSYEAFCTLLMAFFANSDVLSETERQAIYKKIS